MTTRLLLILACGAVAGCATTKSATTQAEVPAQTAATTPKTGEVNDLKPPGEAKVGDRTRCVVSGDSFTVDADSPHVEYQGKTYYLCCDSCVDDFKADPARYLAPKPSP